MGELRGPGRGDQRPAPQRAARRPVTFFHESYDWFPYAAVIIVAVFTVYAFVLNSGHSDLAGRVGSLVADE